MKNSTVGFFLSLSGLPFLFLMLFCIGEAPAFAAEQVIPCPATVMVGGEFVGKASEGWTGSGEAGPYAFREAKIVNQNMLCTYTQPLSMSFLWRPWEAGTTCTFAADQKTWNCKNATGVNKSYACLPSMMIHAKLQTKLPDGWQEGGESAPFPFLEATPPDPINKVLRCAYRTTALTFSLVRPKPAGLCSFDTAKMSWICRSVAPDIKVNPLPNQRLPIPLIK